MGICATKDDHNKKDRHNSMKKKKTTPALVNKEKLKCGDESTLREQLQAVFKKYDQNRDGILSRKEVQYMIKEMNGRQQYSKSDDDMDIMVEKLVGRA